MALTLAAAAAQALLLQAPNKNFSCYTTSLPVAAACSTQDVMTSARKGRLAGCSSDASASTLQTMEVGVEGSVGKKRVSGQMLSKHLRPLLFQGMVNQTDHFFIYI